jgi:DNA-binding transcriptional ArsR family regulator
MPGIDDTAETLKLLGEPTRLRLLALLSDEELSVAELTEITQLPQPRISTHLGRLKEAGWVQDRRVANQAFYKLANDGLSAEAKALWLAVRGGAADPILDDDRERRISAVRLRQGGWAEAVAGSMARHYSPGRTWPSMVQGLLGLVQLGDVIDIASGDGSVAELLASRARKIVCLERSQRVLQVGTERLAHIPNISFVGGDMHALPFADGSFDTVLMWSALQYSTDPRQALCEAARVLRPGGSFVATTLMAHRHSESDRYGHQNQGFELAVLQDWLQAAGFGVSRCEVTVREQRAPHFEVITVYAALAAR